MILPFTNFKQRFCFLNNDKRIFMLNQEYLGTDIYHYIPNMIYILLVMIFTCRCVKRQNGESSDLVVSKNSTYENKIGQL